jgi:hypothetical protein
MQLAVRTHGKNYGFLYGVPMNGYVSPFVPYDPRLKSFLESSRGKAPQKLPATPGLKRPNRFPDQRSMADRYDRRSINEGNKDRLLPPPVVIPAEQAAAMSPPSVMGGIIGQVAPVVGTAMNRSSVMDDILGGVKPAVAASSQVGPMVSQVGPMALSALSGMVTDPRVQAFTGSIANTVSSIPGAGTAMAGTHQPYTGKPYTPPAPSVAPIARQFMTPPSRQVASQLASTRFANLEAQAEQDFISSVLGSPERKAFDQRQSQTMAHLQGMQGRLADSGNSQLGYDGNADRVMEMLYAGQGAEDRIAAIQSPYGRSVMPGVVARGGVTNVVGSPTMSALLDSKTDASIAEREARSAATAERVAANHAQQLEQNAHKLQEWGYSPDQPFIGGKVYVGGNEYRGISNAARAQQEMSPEQLNKYEASRAARKAEMELGRQRQFARAQGREQHKQQMQLASQQAMAEQASNPLNHPLVQRAIAINPDLTASFYGHMLNAQQANVANQRDQRRSVVDEMLLGERMQQNQYAQSEMAHKRAMELAGLNVEKEPESATVKELLGDRNQFISLPVEERSRYFDDAVSLAEANPNDPTGMESLNAIPDDYILSEFESAAEYPKWMQELTPAEKSIRDLHLDNLRKVAKRRGLVLPDKQVEQVPWLMGTAQWLEDLGL